MAFFHTFMHQLTKFPKPFWWVILATLMHQIGNMAIVFLLPYLTTGKQFSLEYSTLFYATFSGSMLVGSAISHQGLRLMNNTKLLMVILFINAVCLFLLPFFNTSTTLLLIIVVWGIAFGAYRPISQSVVSELANQNSHRITFTIYRWVINFGMSIGPAVGGFMATYSFRSLFFLNAAADCVAGFILLLSLKNLILEKPSTKVMSIQTYAWLKDRNFLFFLMGLLPASMIFFQHDSTLSIFLTQDLLLPLSFYGLLFTFNSLLIITVEFPLNLFMMHWHYRTNFLLGMFFIGVGFVGLAFATSAWHVVLLAICWTLGEMIFYPSASSFVAEISSSQQRGAYMSMYSTFANLGMLLGPLGGGIILSKFNASILWYCCGLITLISFYCFIKITEPHTQTTPLPATAL